MGLDREMSKLETNTPRRIRNGRDSSVKSLTTAIEDHARHTGRDCTLSNNSADQTGRFHVATCFQRCADGILACTRGGNRPSQRVVDDLSVNVTSRRVHR